jgi:para-nitrobenzyl esterase
VSAFKGIRYGRAARFARAVAEPFDGPPVDATQFGPVCPQRGMADARRGLPVPQRVDARGASWRGRAVMVYFHGGAYANGSVTDPSRKARIWRRAATWWWSASTIASDRSAMPGCDRSTQAADSGNLGQLDLILALQWVRDHIAAFGAILAGRGVRPIGRRGQDRHADGAAGGERPVPCGATMSGQQVQASGPGHALARTAPGLLAAGRATMACRPCGRCRWSADRGAGRHRSDHGRRVGLFRPVLDMTNLPRHPFWPDAAPQSLHVPMILGNVRDETRAFLDPRGPKLAGLTWDNLPSAWPPK